MGYWYVSSPKGNLFFSISLSINYIDIYIYNISCYTCYTHTYHVCVNSQMHLYVPTSLHIWCLWLENFPVSYLRFGHVFVPILSRRIKREKKHHFEPQPYIEIRWACKYCLQEMCVLKFVRSIVYHMVVVFCHYHFSGSYPYANMLFVESDKDKSNRDHLTSWPPNPYEEVLVHGHFSFCFSVV